MPKNKKRVFILGAGLCGLSAAWYLQKQGVDCTVLEKNSSAGGLCRSKIIKDFTFDIDGHLLHFKSRSIFNFIKSLLGDNFVEHNRSSWIYFKGKYFRYPFQANLYGFPPDVARECLLGFIRANSDKESWIKCKNVSFLDWIKHTFGDGIARYFMIPYNEKFWRYPLARMNCGWLDGFIPVPSLSELIDGTLEESKVDFGYNKTFWYPKKGGICQIADSLSGKIKDIRFDSNVIHIDFKNKEITYGNNQREQFDYLISTIPMPELSGIISSIPKGVRNALNRLSWNSVLNVNLGFNRRFMPDKHWVYFPQKDISFFRVGFFDNICPSLSPKNKQSVYVEISYPQSVSINKRSLIKKAKKDMLKVGLIKKVHKVIAEDVNDIKYAYPVYDDKYYFSRNIILDFLGKNATFCVGRYGSWQYFSMEDSIADGIKAANKLADILK
ncbi:MAG: FAD-dependent oxidoreductase [Candidatus Gygaella obscura]|nr:FAD-dependent oxidoreductase [Candidatus Gygaella obscura]